MLIFNVKGFSMKKSFPILRSMAASLARSAPPESGFGLGHGRPAISTSIRGLERFSFQAQQLGRNAGAT
jgi:hypothetical protein